MKNFSLKMLLTMVFVALFSVAYGQTSATPLDSDAIHPFGSIFSPFQQFASIGESGGVPGPTITGCDLYGFRAQFSLDESVNIGMQKFTTPPPGFLGLPTLFPVISTSTDLGLGIVEQNTIGGLDLGCGNLLAYFKQSLTGSNVFTILGSATAFGGSFSPSDRNLKRNLQPITNALEIVSQLNGYTYEYRTDEYPELNLTKGQRYGFVTQEVQKVMPTIVRQSNDVQGRATTIQVMEYDAVIPVLAEAIKMQQVVITNLEDVVTDLEKENNKLEARLARLEAIILKEEAPSKRINGIDDANGVKLDQNRPNPSNATTIIGYTLPKGMSTAILVVLDLNGQQVSSQTISAGTGAVELNTSNLPAGVYVYSIVVEGRSLARKKMTVQ